MEEKVSSVDAIHAIARAVEANAMALVEAASAIGALIEDYREKTTFPTPTAH